ncbi:hypothetical protein [Xanthomonas graminis]|uniref:Secreted protein n=1 Tax=Xanthomonas graminis pv. phlei TaxID=487906 RepID=A0A0K3A2V2_9XANT|nr:hypothetical protein [Xanthomonas translucens]CTP92416.1 hypothetical protein XTPLMG730_3485 [Xanthomonas translucens pv. phlei]
MARALNCRTAVLIGLAALPAAAAPAAAPPPTVIYVTPVSDEAKGIGYIPVRNAPSEEAELGAWRGLKKPLRVFDKGAEDGVATPLAFSVDDNSMCGGDLRVRLKTAHGATFAHDALLASFDLNLPASASPAASWMPRNGAHCCRSWAPIRPCASPCQPRR